MMTSSDTITWTDAAGREWTAATPKRTRDLLAIEAWLALEVLPAQAAGEALPARAWQQLAAWLSHQTRDVRGVRDEAGRRWSEAGGVTWVATLLTLVQQLDYLRTIQAAVSLPPEALDGVATMHEVLNLDGCECRVCAGLWPVERRVEALCKYAKVPHASWAVWSMAAPLLDGDLLHSPWWVYQVAQAQRRGQGKAHRKADKRRRAREEMDQILSGSKKGRG